MKELINSKLKEIEENEYKKLPQAFRRIACGSALFC